MTHTPTHPRPAPSPRRGYTLVEMLIVIGIIVLMVGIALPAFRAITGGRSEEGATNQVTSMLARARADAIATQQPRGVAVFTDATGQCRVAEVGAVTFGMWVKVNSPNLPYVKGNYVTYFPSSSSPPQYYVCTANILANSNTDISDATHWQQLVNGATSQAAAWASVWASVTPVLYDQLPDTDPVVLPVGVGVQVIADDSTLGSATTGKTDRYLHNGVLIFDASGRLSYQQQAFSQYGVIGGSAGFNLANVQRSTAGLTPSQQFLLDSSFGLVLYDREALANQGFPAAEPTFVATATYGTVGASPPSEADEEAWLDVNATPLLINRYTGALVRGE